MMRRKLMKRETLIDKVPTLNQDKILQKENYQRIRAVIV